MLTGYFFIYQPGDQMQMINFMKNLTIAGGFLLLAVLGPAPSHSTIGGDGYRSEASHRNAG